MSKPGLNHLISIVWFFVGAALILGGCVLLQNSFELIGVASVLLGLVAVHISHRLVRPLKIEHFLIVVGVALVLAGLSLGTPFSHVIGFAIEQISITFSIKTEVFQKAIELLNHNYPILLVFFTVVSGLVLIIIGVYVVIRIDAHTRVKIDDIDELRKLIRYKGNERD